jgi:hypothetical protein
MTHSVATATEAAPSTFQRVLGFVDARPLFALTVAMTLGLCIGKLTKGD